MHENVKRNFDESSVNKNQYVSDAQSVQNRKDLEHVYYNTLLAYSNIIIDLIKKNNMMSDKPKCCTYY